MSRFNKLFSMVATLALVASCFVSKGMSQPLGENFISDDPIELTKPKMLNKTEPQPLGLTKIQTIPTSNPKSVKVSDPKMFQPTVTEKGVRVYRPVKKYKAYEKCAQLKSFDERLECARQGIRGGSEQNK